MLIPIAWSYGLAVAAYGAFALYLAFRRPRTRETWALVAAAVLTVAWGVMGLWFALSGHPWLLVLTAIVSILQTGAWYALLLLSVERSAVADSPVPRFKAGWLSGIALAIVAAGLGGTALGFASFGAVVDPNRALVYYGVAAAVFGLTLVEIFFRNIPEDARWHARPLAIGLAGIFVFDLYLYGDALLFGRVDLEVWSARGFVCTLALPLVALSATRSRDQIPRFTISRQMVYRSTALVASGVYLLFMAIAGYWVRDYGGSWGRALQVAFLFAAVLLLGVIGFSGSMRARWRVGISKHFFRYRYDYREEWLRFTRMLSTREGDEDIGGLVVRGLAGMVESPAGALWVHDSARHVYAQRARWNMAASGATEDELGPLARFLAESGWVVNLAEHRSSPAVYQGMQLPEWLSHISDAWLVVPLATRDELIGFVVLTTARARIDVNWEVNDLLKCAGRQAASFLDQMRAAEALLEARKFDSFNRMSAFVVHDLKNIVSQLSLMLRNAERHSAKPEFQQDMLMTVGHSVERMKQLMMQLREGTTPVDTPKRVDLEPVIRRVLHAKAANEPQPEFAVESGAAVAGHPDRLERVIGHLLQNALDATEAGGRVWIRLGRQDGHALVEVGDTGRGMTADFLRDRLFKPFQTTKGSGMGIGAYESHQYVHELGGQMLVESAPGRGTLIRLLLPLHDTPVARADSPQPREAA